MLPYFTDNDSSVGELFETDLLLVQPHRGFGCMAESPSTAPAPPLPSGLTSSTSLEPLGYSKIQADALTTALAFLRLPPGLKSILFSSPEVQGTHS